MSVSTVEQRATETGREAMCEGAGTRCVSPKRHENGTLFVLSSLPNELLQIAQEVVVVALQVALSFHCVKS